MTSMVSRSTWSQNPESATARLAGACSVPLTGRAWRIPWQSPPLRKLRIFAKPGPFRAVGLSGDPKKLRVLFVEDEAMIRMMVADMLEELGHTVTAEAGHIDEALEVAHRPTVATLLDVHRLTAYGEHPFSAIGGPAGGAHGQDKREEAPAAGMLSAELLRSLCDRPRRRPIAHKLRVRCPDARRASYSAHITSALSAPRPPT
jgi:CheY-like chemotaxis protein